MLLRAIWESATPLCIDYTLQFAQAVKVLILDIEKTDFFCERMNNAKSSVKHTYALSDP